MSTTETTEATLPAINDRLTTREVMRMLDCTDECVYRMVRRGELTGWRLGKGNWRFHKGEVESLARASFKPARAGVAG